MDKTKQHKKKKVGALIAAIVVCLIVVIYAAFYVAGILISGMSGSLPTIILIIIGVLALAVIGGCIAALIQRFKEIEGGEEDEASQY